MVLYSCLLHTCVSPYLCDCQLYGVNRNVYVRSNSQFSQVESANDLKHDVVILSVQAIELTPQADNPLSRLVLDNDLYRRNQNKMDLPGSLGLFDNYFQYHSTR